MERLDADVCVVGAGFAGLSAAWRLHQAGGASGAGRLSARSDDRALSLSNQTR